MLKKQARLYITPNVKIIGVKGSVVLSASKPDEPFISDNTGTEPYIWEEEDDWDDDDWTMN